MTIQSEPTKSTTKSTLPKISVVDDDPDLLALFKDLADAGHFVLLGAYSQAQTALAHLPQCPPDVVFMDVRLPDLSGIECTRKLTTILPYLEVVILTGHPDRETFVKSLMAGAKGFVSKPCTVEEILAAVSDLLNFGVVLGKSSLPYLQGIIRQFRYLDPASNLTEREEQMLACIFKGMSYKEIASGLKIGLSTVHTHMDRLFKKMGIHSRKELIAKFLQA